MLKSGTWLALGDRVRCLDGSYTPWGPVTGHTYTVRSIEVRNSEVLLSFLEIGGVYSVRRFKRLIRVLATTRKVAA